MTESEHDDFDPLFLQLLSSLYSAAMSQMGKVMNPLTGKVERQIEMAKSTIDLLAMLEVKTSGNLSSAEKGYLTHVLYELRMNYLDETGHPSTAAGNAPSKPDAQPAPEA